MGRLFVFLLWIAATGALFLVAAIVFYPHRHVLVSRLKDSSAGPVIVRKKIPPDPEAARDVFRQKIPASDSALPTQEPTEKKPTVTEKDDSALPSPAPPEPKELMNEAESGESLQPQTIVAAPPAPEEGAVSSKSAFEQTESEELPEQAETPEATAPRAGMQPPSPEDAKPAPAPAIETPSETAEIPVTTAIRQPVAPKPGVAVQGVNEDAAEKTIRREAWLLNQDSSAYTLQLMGVRTEALLFDFIEENRLLEENEIAYYRTVFKGEPWFQLLYGIYPTFRAAQRAAADLPGNIRTSTPWIRRLSGIQKAIRRHATR